MIICVSAITAFFLQKQASTKQILLVHFSYLKWKTFHSQQKQPLYSSICLFCHFAAKQLSSTATGISPITFW